MFLKKRKTLTLGLTTILALLILSSCGSFLKDADENAPIARVGENYLYKEDIAPLLYDGMTKGDSTTIVTNFINNWASKQLLLSKAKINLPEEKLAEFDELVSNYQTDLYTRAYKDALVQQAADSMVTDTQLKRFYEKEKENFRLQERIVKIRFVQLPKRFLNKDEVEKRLKSFRKKDVAYLDSIGVQFKKLNFNDSIWVSASRVISEIPPLTPENQSKYLKKSQFFELEDALGVYLAKVTGVLQINDVAPLSFIEPTIKQVLINRRKLNYIRQLETEVIDEAIKENEFEVYGQEN
ncbi:peptidyl-prolyl cis-trans isomerase [Maribacter algarum]|uniref:Peptidyl-prolyl cis-trans isomerase n=1 Tax=Maribacter algarum (ex Zhang et al. 2020) TaxID=2578118 RepID=A0A5S3PJ49_9FLAO|nr:peptidyl-prolyl cis-trans isomerase [Maribacter algarum]TMM53369.1 peptidyl-prolyl cis-trans isomerase [Maribacter algarum]